MIYSAIVAASAGSSRNCKIGIEGDKMETGKPVFLGWFTFTGRRNRLSYSLATGSLIALGVFFHLVIFPAAGLNFTEEEISIYPISQWNLTTILFFVLPTFIYITLSAQRFRDFGWSGGVGACILIAISLPPNIDDDLRGFIAFMAWIILMLVPGKKGENKYGPDPRQS